MLSEVARLRMQIDQEFEAMRNGLYGLSAGSTKHQFIETKMQRIGAYEDQLATHVGKEESARVTCQAYMRVMEEQVR